jgi:hypothetical protein
LVVVVALARSISASVPRTPTSNTAMATRTSTRVKPSRAAREDEDVRIVLPEIGCERRVLEGIG